MRLVTLFFAALLLAPSDAKAGMACPHVQIHYVGSPGWLSNGELLEGLESQSVWLGITSRNIRDSTRGIDNAIELLSVVPGGPADRAGLRRGDFVTAINGEPAGIPSRREAIYAAMSDGDRLALDVRRGSDRLAVSLQVRRADPVFIALRETLYRDDDDCPRADLAIATPELQSAVLNNALTEDRAFRCEDAHEALKVLGEVDRVEDVYMIRGSRRILLTMPHWGTACIPASDLDGENLTDAAARAFLDEVIEDFVQYSYENP